MYRDNLWYCTVKQSVLYPAPRRVINLWSGNAMLLIMHVLVVSFINAQHSTLIVNSQSKQRGKLSVRDYTHRPGPFGLGWLRDRDKAMFIGPPKGGYVVEPLKTYQI